MPSSTQGQIAATTQQYLEIADITKDILLLKDGSTALVMEVSAINFGLLSEPEQDAIIYAYAALINSLSFPIEIVISSRPKDVTSYLEYIDEQFRNAPSQIRRQQIASYGQFVSNLITEQNVLDKNFYVVIPLSAIEVGLMGDANPITSVTGKKNEEFDKNAVVERALNTLIPRRDHMASQFARFGLQSQQLSTKELIQLFYTLYNPQAAEGVKVVDTKDYTTALIQAQGGQQAPAFANQAAAPAMMPQQAPPQNTYAQPTPAPTPQMQAAPTQPMQQPLAQPAPAPQAPPAPAIPDGVAPPPAPAGVQSLNSQQLEATPIPGVTQTPTATPQLTQAPVPAQQASGGQITVEQPQLQTNQTGAQSEPAPAPASPPVTPTTPTQPSMNSAIPQETAQTQQANQTQVQPR